MKIQIKVYLVRLPILQRWQVHVVEETASRRYEEYIFGY